MNDQFQCIDLTDNDITNLGGFSSMKRLRTLLIHNNPISSIAVNLSRTLPFLSSLVMSDNKLEVLADIDRLSSLRHLDTLILTGNPVTLKKYYRLYTIFKIPSLQVLDYQRVRLEERRAAKKLFESGAGQKLDEAVKTAVSVAAKQQQDVSELPADALERRAAIEKAIAEAKTEEELEKLNAMLSMGVVPKLQENGDDKKRVSGDDSSSSSNKRLKS